MQKCRFVGCGFLFHTLFKMDLDQPWAAKQTKQKKCVWILYDDCFSPSFLLLCFLSSCNAKRIRVGGEVLLQAEDDGMMVECVVN